MIFVWFNSSVIRWQQFFFLPSFYKWNVLVVAFASHTFKAIVIFLLLLSFHWCSQFGWGLVGYWADAYQHRYKYTICTIAAQRLWGLQCRMRHIYMLDRSWALRWLPILYIFVPNTKLMHLLFVCETTTIFHEDIQINSNLSRMILYRICTLHGYEVAGVFCSLACWWMVNHFTFHVIPVIFFRISPNCE